jgi:hypothetical protein
MATENQYPDYDTKLTNSYRRRAFCGMDSPSPVSLLPGIL